MKNIQRTVYTVLIILSLPFSVFGQSQPGIISTKVPRFNLDNANVNLPDSLMRHNEKTGLFYLLENDSSRLYVFIKATDKITENKIMMRGITVAINSKGKRKTKTSLSFPYLDKDVLQTQMTELRMATSELQREEILKSREEMIHRYNQIKVMGLNKIKNGLISVDNQYGIQAKIWRDSAGDLMEEMGIPFQYVGIMFGKKDEIAVNIALTGFSWNGDAGSGGGGMHSGSWDGGGRAMYGRGGMRNGGFHQGERGQPTGSYRNSSSPERERSSDFWIIGPLAK